MVESFFFFFFCISKAKGHPSKNHPQEAHLPNSHQSTQARSWDRLFTLHFCRAMLLTPHCPKTGLIYTRPPRKAIVDLYVFHAKRSSSQWTASQVGFLTGSQATYESTSGQRRKFSWAASRVGVQGFFNVRGAFPICLGEQHS